MFSFFKAIFGSSDSSYTLYDVYEASSDFRKIPFSAFSENQIEGMKKVEVAEDAEISGLSLSHESDGHTVRYEDDSSGEKEVIWNSESEKWE